MSAPEPKSEYVDHPYVSAYGGAVDQCHYGLRTGNPCLRTRDQHIEPTHAFEEKANSQFRRCLHCGLGPSAHPASPPEPARCDSFRPEAITAPEERKVTITAEPAPESDYADEIPGERPHTEEPRPDPAPEPESEEPRFTTCFNCGFLGSLILHRRVHVWPDAESNGWRLKSFCSGGCVNALRAKGWRIEDARPDPTPEPAPESEEPPIIGNAYETYSWRPDPEGSRLRRQGGAQVTAADAAGTDDAFTHSRRMPVRYAHAFIPHPRGRDFCCHTRREPTGGRRYCGGRQCDHREEAPRG